VQVGYTVPLNKSQSLPTRNTSPVTTACSQTPSGKTVNLHFSPYAFVTIATYRFSSSAKEKKKEINVHQIYQAHSGSSAPVTRI